MCPPVHGVSSVAVVEVLVIHSEGVALAAESEGPVPCEPPVAGPVLHVHRQLVRSVVVDVGQRPHQDVPQPELSVKVPEADLATNHSSVSPHSDQSDTCSFASQPTLCDSSFINLISQKITNISSA